jgi:phosphatidylglycerophosphate synthase
MRSNVTPNQASLATALLAVPMLVAGAAGQLLLTGLLLQVASVLDGVDGEIARAKGLQSKFGALLDPVLDYTIDAAGVTALGLALLRLGEVPADLVLLLASATIAVRLISQFVVKNVPTRRPHIPGEKRDVTTMLIFLGAAAASFWGDWYLVATLAFVNVWRIDNTVFRLYRFWQQDRLGPPAATRLVIGVVERPAAVPDSVDGESVAPSLPPA